MTDVQSFSPGALVRARGREWVVLPSQESDLLHLRPLGGSEEDQIVLVPSLEREPVVAAVFDPPSAAVSGNHDASRLLRDALQLKLRAGCGPFRSFGHIAVEPRPYQLVPLLMALRQDTVRLLIADDVGIGKTIEAGLIARELLDRAEIQRIAVLCPPHLVEQWQSELAERFHLRAAAITSSSVKRLERELPQGVSLFDEYPYTVVSLDYIKSDRHRHDFLASCPEFVIVDEAHTCAQAGQTRHQRFELLQGLAEDQERHLVLLTATPHSGDDSAFYNLLSLLHPDFEQLRNLADGVTRDKLKDRLALHFVQRRRPDIEDFQTQRVFPRRLTTEVTYRLTGGWGRLFDQVLDYCVGLAERAESEGEANRSRMMWYATLALLRCVASSPASAVNALRTRMEGRANALELDEEARERVFDGVTASLSADDVEPAAGVEEVSQLRELITQAEALSGIAGDPKLAALVAHLKDLVGLGFQPVVFCRYIATAHYVSAALQRVFPRATVISVTGELTPEERRERIEALTEIESRILVATDCLSEGINIQHLFTAVVHYDLAWNPTRHEQREGRVDRFGQPSPEVRSTLLWGEDNPVDGFILRVILRKAETIKKELGVVVPVPDDDNRLTQALLKAVLLRRREKSPQSAFDFSLPDEAKAAETEWEDAWENAKKSRTRFKQGTIKPERVFPELDRQNEVLGSVDAVERFVKQACARLGSPLEDWRGANKLLPEHLPSALRERLEAEGIAKPLPVDFRFPPVAGAHWLHRSHPVVAALADTLLESALDNDTRYVARAGVCRTDEVPVVTTLALLRLRHQLALTRHGQTRLLLAEETVAVAWAGRTQPKLIEGTEALKLLDAKPAANVAEAKREAELNRSLTLIAAEQPRLNELAQARAEQLLADHRRVRDAAQAHGSYAVTPCLPVDVMGLFVLLPNGL